MNERADIAPVEGTAVALPTGTDLARILTGGQVDGILEQIEKEVRSQTPDLTTAKGRKAIASLAYRVARSKMALDEAGKALNADKRKEIEAVDAERRKVRERLDALRDEVRAPLLEWEEKEEARISRHRSALDHFDHGRTDPRSDPDAIRAVIQSVEAIQVDDSWDEYETIAAKTKADALAKYRADLDLAVERVAQEEELARLRAEATERERKEREEAERKAAEEAERQRKEAAEAEARRRAEAEAAEKARIEREKKEAAERAAKEAQERAAREAREAEERHQRELAEARAREERAAQAERDRMAAEKRAAEAARAKREKDRKHRARIRNEIAQAVSPYLNHNALTLADALIDGKVPHTTVNL